jgi:hypothetical protein
MDFLVESRQWRSFQELAIRYGFFEVPTWGYRPHHFFYAYDKSRDCWHKLDVVTEIAYGSPVPALRTDLAARCLKNRRPRGRVFLMKPEDELVTLLLHCILDKAAFEARHIKRLRQLQAEVGDVAYLDNLVSHFWPAPATWDDLAEALNADEWNRLLVWRRILSRRLAVRHPASTPVRIVTGSILQRLNRWRGWLQPRTPLVALMAPDGAGKSTLAAGLQQSFVFPVRRLYMGLYQRGTERGLVRYLPKGLSFAGRLLGLWWRYGTARYYQLRRRWVIFDRYSYDALMEPPGTGGRLSRWRRRILGHALPAPDLVVVLDVPAHILHQRKDEQDISTLERQRQFYLRLSQERDNVAVVDATAGADQVRRAVTALMWQQFVGQRRRFASAKEAGSAALKGSKR